jgi:hypothetical protein
VTLTRIIILRACVGDTRIIILRAFVGDTYTCHNTEGV